MPQIEISEETLARLQKHAVALVDDADSAIRKLIDFKENTSSTPATFAPGVKDYSTGKLPDLRDTKILSAMVAGKALPPEKMNWNRLLDEAIGLAAVKLKDPKALGQYIIIKHVIGKKENQGFRYLAKAGISVQGQDATRAWKTAAHLFKEMQLAAEVVFLWSDSDKAAYPGKTGKLKVDPRAEAKDAD
jgi:hypothetical protein